VLAVFVDPSNGQTIVHLSGTYNYIRVINLNQTPLQSITVSAKFSNDFNIALTQYSDSYTANTMYEILIGGWSNTASVIRYIIHDTCNNSQNIESEIFLATSIVRYIILLQVSTLPWRGGQVSSPLGFSFHIINYYFALLLLHFVAEGTTNRESEQKRFLA